MELEDKKSVVLLSLIIIVVVFIFIIIGLIIYKEIDKNKINNKISVNNKTWQIGKVTDALIEEFVKNGYEDIIINDDTEIVMDNKIYTEDDKEHLKYIVNGERLSGSSYYLELNNGVATFVNNETNERKELSVQNIKKAYHVFDSELIGYILLTNDGDVYITQSYDDLKYVDFDSYYSEVKNQNINKIEFSYFTDGKEEYFDEYLGIKEDGTKYSINENRLYDYTFKITTVNSKVYVKSNREFYVNDSKEEGKYLAHFIADYENNYTVLLLTDENKLYYIDDYKAVIDKKIKKVYLKTEEDGSSLYQTYLFVYEDNEALQFSVKF